MKYVYVSGPYSQGDVEANVKRALDATDALMDAGYYPYCPHLSHFQHQNRARAYEDWMRLDLAWVERCDAVVRLSGYSPGAERECIHAEQYQIPVFIGVESFFKAEGVKV